MRTPPMAAGCTWQAGRLLLLLSLSIAAISPAKAQQAQQQQPQLEPFRGLTTNGHVQPGLFPIKATGLSLQPMREAALAFLRTLTAAERSKTQFPIQSEQRRRWTNISEAERVGLSYGEMTQPQRERADALLRSVLSAEGYRQSKDIMVINGYLAEVTGNSHRYGSDKFWISIYGEPSATQPWGWRLEGHHLVLLVSVIGDQVVLTPSFMGAEPTRITTGPHRGVAVMGEQEARGRALLESLTAAQQRQAQLSSVKGGTNILAEAYKDNLILPQAGISARLLTSRQRQLLMAVVQSFTDQYRGELSNERLREVQEHLDETTFAWIGSSGQESPIYYRIQSPVVLIEFDQQRPLSLPGDRNIPIKTHVHTMVRTPNGNDYGADLLRQHLLQEHSTTYTNR